MKEKFVKFLKDMLVFDLYLYQIKPGVSLHNCKPENYINHMVGEDFVDKWKFLSVAWNDIISNSHPVYGGEIKYFPSEVINEMMAEQARQGNIPDYSVFELNVRAGAEFGGFDWHKSVLGFDKWNEIIGNGKFDLSTPIGEYIVKFKNKMPFSCATHYGPLSISLLHVTFGSGENTKSYPLENIESVKRINKTTYESDS